MVERAKPRLPKGQYLTERWPILHAGAVPRADLERWTFRMHGLVEREVTLTWQEFMALPKMDYRCDIHCVTTWSRFDNVFTGVPFRVIFELCKPRTDAQYAMVEAENGFAANLPLKELLRSGVMFAHAHNGETLTPEHGYPLRLVVPHLYFWKSAKWVRGVEFMAEDSPGFWEERGYHMLGDPWVTDESNPDGQRFRDDPAWFGDRSPELLDAWRKDVERKRGLAESP